ncbi:MAG TPA: response regulator [Kofleriaceae bacterium]|nr:response regulator [Kofleriaceae bacterium]
MTARPDSLASRLPSAPRPARSVVGAEVLVIDQDVRVHEGMGPLLSAVDLHVTCVADPAAGAAKVKDQFFSVVLVDVDTPIPSAGVQVIRELHQLSPTSMIIGLTPRRSFEDAVAAVRAGAIDLVLKAPDSVPYLRQRVVEAAGLSIGRREVDSVLVEIRDLQGDFLERFMDAERRASDLGDRLAGKDPARSISFDNLAVLLIDEVDSLRDALTEAAPAGFRIVHAASGGEGLDRMSSDRFHYALVSEELGDLPPSMIISALRAQNADTVILTFRGPGEGGSVSLVETGGPRVLLPKFSDGAELAARLDEMAEAFRARARERRYLQAFRERHYDFLRRFVEIKTKIDRAMNEGPG